MIFLQEEAHYSYNSIVLFLQEEAHVPNWFLKSSYSDTMAKDQWSLPLMTETMVGGML